MNEASIALSRTNAKIMRELYKVYEAKLKSTYPVDTDGTLTVGMVKYFEGLGDKIFENMAAALEISSGETIVDKTSNLLTGDKCLIVSYNWQPTGCVNQISGTLHINKS